MTITDETLAQIIEAGKKARVAREKSPKMPEDYNTEIFWRKYAANHAVEMAQEIQRLRAQLDEAMIAGYLVGKQPSKTFTPTPAPDDQITRDGLAIMDAAERGDWQEAFT